MTRLFNLESYLECCQYARIFQQQPEQLIPQEKELPILYKKFLQDFSDRSYLQEPTFPQKLPSQLTLNSDRLDYLSVGIELNDSENQRLFIIPDTVDLFTLSTSSFLDYRDTYIYNSVYHYWNHYKEICQHHIDEPLVFIDLDSFSCKQLIPIQPDSNERKIPVLNTKNPLKIDLTYQSVEKYNSICKDVANYIIENNFPYLGNNETINNLSIYLQKISFFKIIQPYVQQESFTLVIEINLDRKIFYKQVTLSVAKIVEIVITQINTKAFNEVTKKYPNYQFVLVTQFNIFPQVVASLPEFLCLNPTYQEFPSIWQERKEQNFSLFGIYLDTIEFAIRLTNGSKQWFKLCDQESEDHHISYEGKPKVLVGYTGEQDFFSIAAGLVNASLPIKVNGKEHLKNNIAQDYSIEIINRQKEEKIPIKIKMEFHLKPGFVPELKVIDLSGKYKINAELADRQTSYIPPDKIKQNRLDKSSKQIENLQKQNKAKFNSFKSKLSDLLKLVSQIGADGYDYEKLTQSLDHAYQQLRREQEEFDLLQYIEHSSCNVYIITLKSRLKNNELEKVVKIVSELLEPGNKLDKIKFLEKVFLFVGKTYQLSKYLLPNQQLFQQSMSIFNGKEYINLGNEYFKCFARVAVTGELQKQYFSLFQDYYELYTISYMWGYGRILLWYYNFDSDNKLLDYQQHFTKIIEHLIEKTPEYFKGRDGYLQDNFLALVYLLSFRAKDKNFCSPNSQEIILSKKLINRYYNEKINLNSVNRKKSLNKIFQEMIEGNSSEDDLNNLISV